MARPIEPTPKLRGEDARRLLRDLERRCTPAQYKARVEAARERLGDVFHENADALYHDASDPPGVMRVVRTGKIHKAARRRTG